MLTFGYDFAFDRSFAKLARLRASRHQAQRKINTRNQHSKSISIPTAGRSAIEIRPASKTGRFQPPWTPLGFDLHVLWRELRPQQAKETTLYVPATLLLD